MQKPNDRLVSVLCQVTAEKLSLHCLPSDLNSEH